MGDIENQKLLFLMDTTVAMDMITLQDRFDDQSNSINGTLNGLQAQIDQLMSDEIDIETHDQHLKEVDGNMTDIHDNMTDMHDNMTDIYDNLRTPVIMSKIKQEQGIECIGDTS